MAKLKQASVQNKILYSRASYLYQAAQYLANFPPPSNDSSSSSSLTQSKPSDHHSHNTTTPPPTQNLSRLLSRDLRAVCLKAQIRQTPHMKRGTCKFCDTPQLEGKTCLSTVENPSRGGKKPWADVLVMTCLTCGNCRRWPVGVGVRQKRKHLREASDAMRRRMTVGKKEKEREKEEEEGSGMEVAK